MRRVEFTNPVPVNTGIQFQVTGYDDQDNVVFSDMELVPVTADTTAEDIQAYINRRKQEHFNGRLELAIKAKELAEQLGG